VIRVHLFKTIMLCNMYTACCICSACR